MTQTYSGQLIVVMGVSGCGKSTLAGRLARRLDAQFVEADDLHTDAAKLHMQSGQALTDAMRAPWIEAICRTIETPKEQATVLACSALRRFHRQKLRDRAKTIRFLYLYGESSLIANRIKSRRKHFMPHTLLASQFQTLDWPGDENDVTWLDISQPRQQLLAIALEAVSP